MSFRKRSNRPFNIAAVVAAVIFTAVLFLARDVLIPITLSALFAFLLGGPVSWLERRRWPRVGAVMAVVVVAFTAIGSVGYVVGVQVVSLAENLDTYRDEIRKKVDRVRGGGEGVGGMLERLTSDLAGGGPATRPTSDAATRPAEESTGHPAGGAATQPGVAIGAAAERVPADRTAMVAAVMGGTTSAVPTTAPAGSTPLNPIYTVAQSSPASPVQMLLTYLGVIAGPLGTASVVAVFVVFMLLEREALRDRFIAVISRGNYTVTTRAIDDAAARISRYLIAQSIVNGSYGLVIALGLFVIGVVFGHGVWFPSFVLWGLLCALLRFIPYVGPAVSSLFPIALALAVYPGFTVAIAVGVLFIVVELISNNVMEPWLYGTSTGLSTVAILAAAVFWTWLWGGVGLLMATPLTVCMAVIGKYVTPLRFLHVLLGDEDALPPAVRYYQRLLAADRADGAHVVVRLAGAKGAGVVPDVVYLPALRMARRDRASGTLTAEDETRIFDDTLAIVRPPGKLVPPDASLPPVACCPQILACPAHHRADEITMHVLAEALMPLGVKTTVMSTRSLPVDVERAVERDKPAIVVIGIMPPGGLPQAAYLCRRLRKKFPDLPILVGFWGRSRNFDKLLVRLRKAGASYVLTSVEQTRGQVGAMLPKPPASLPADEPVDNPS